MSPQYQNVGGAATVGTVLVRLDELSRRVASLESGLTADIRRILQILQARDIVSSTTVQGSQATPIPSQTSLKNSLSVPHPNDVSQF